MPVSRKRGCPRHLREVAGCQTAAVRKDRRKKSQEAFRCLSFPDWENGSTLPVAPARSLNVSPTQSLELSRGKKSSPYHGLLTIHPLRTQMKIPRLSARLPEHSLLPALGFSGPVGCCSKPQAGIAASRHRASSSASLLLLLLSKSLRAPLGAAILGHRKGLWGALPLATLLHNRAVDGEARGIVGIVVLRLSSPLATVCPEGFLKHEGWKGLIGELHPLPVEENETYRGKGIA